MTFIRQKSMIDCGMRLYSVALPSILPVLPMMFIRIGHRRKYFLCLPMVYWPGYGQAMNGKSLTPQKKFENYLVFDR